MLLDSLFSQNIFSFCVIRHVIFYSSGTIFESIFFIWSIFTCLIRNNNFFSISTKHNISIVRHDDYLTINFFSFYKWYKFIKNRSIIKIILWLID